jgi:hypothetical protein
MGRMGHIEPIGYVRPMAVLTASDPLACIIHAGRENTTANRSFIHFVNKAG